MYNENKEVKKYRISTLTIILPPIICTIIAEIMLLFNHNSLSKGEIKMSDKTAIVVALIGVITALAGVIFTTIKDIKYSKFNGESLKDIKLDTNNITTINQNAKNTNDYILTNKNDFERSIKYIENLNKDLEYRNRLSKDSAVANKDLVVSSVDKIFTDNVDLKLKVNDLEIEKGKLIIELNIKNEKIKDLELQLEEYTKDKEIIRE